MIDLSNAAREIKDRAIETLLRGFFNERFGEYGTAIACHVDTAGGRIELTAKLRGESEPTVAALERYEIEHGNAAQAWILLCEFSSSRTWLALLLTRVYGGRRYPLPAVISRLL